VTRYGMVIDITRCNGCYNCFLVCRDEFCGNDFLPYSVSQPLRGHFWMRIIEKERGVYPQVIRTAYEPVPCMQCENASCVKAASKGEIYKREDGIVIIDPEKSKGRKDLVSSCPYRVIFWNEEKQVPQKCTFCAHLLDAGYKEPRCVEACPTGALVFGDLDDPNSEISKLVASGKTEVFHPEYGLQEKVRYIGLPKRYIAGSVVFGDKDECAGNVAVALIRGNEREVIYTSNFGDFEFEVPVEKQEYTIEIKHEGYITRSFSVVTTSDIYLGDIVLTAV